LKVQLLKKKNLHPKKYQIGDVADIPDSIAKRWIDRRIAKPLIEETDTEKYIDHPRVSIVILVKDALDYFKVCIESIIRFTDNYELIIVDNNSGIETKQYLETLDFNFKLITNKKNRGVSYGWNQGIKIAESDYICILNSDTIVSENWLGKLLKGFDYKDNVGIVGPTGISTKGTSSSIITEIDIKDEDCIDKVNEAAQTLKEGYEERKITAYCWVIKRKVFDAIGVFDWRRFGIASHEDVDFRWRADKFGFISVWCKGAYVHHFGGKSTSNLDDYEAIKEKNYLIREQRKKDDPDLYIKNDVKISRVKNVTSIKNEPVSIVIPVKDTLDCITECLDSIERFTINYELIIIDNNSGEATKEFLTGKQKSMGFTLITNKKNKGFAYACNQGIKVAKYNYICLLNSDTVVSPGWLEKMLPAFKYPQAGIVGPSSCFVTGRQQIKHLSRKRFDMQLKDIIKVSNKLEEGIIELERVYGFCFLLSKKVVEAIGVFDHKGFPIGGGEEIDYDRRAREAGFKLYWVKHAYVHHRGHKTFKESKIDMASVSKLNSISKQRNRERGTIYFKNTTRIYNVKYPPDKVIYTANIDNVDKLNTGHYDNPSWTYIVFGNSSVDGWETAEIKRKFEDSRRQARMYKWLAHKYIKAEYSLWIDSNVIINTNLDELVDKYLNDCDIAICLHRDRNCIYKEAEVCRRYRLDKPEIIDKQIKHYRNSGYPKNNGLHETTVVLRRHTKDIEKFNEAVWNKIKHGSIRDQLAVDYVAWDMGIKIGTLPGKFYEDNYFKVMPHKKRNRRYD